MSATPALSQELVQEFVGNAHGNLERVRELLAHEPALLNARWERFDEAAIEAASHMGQRAIAEYLLDQGAPLSICTAAMLGQVDQVAAFLRDDPSLARAHGAHGIPVLYHAALSGRTDVAELLLAHGGGEGIDDALHAAARFGHTDMLRWLLDHGARDINVLNYEQKTPLQVARDQGFSDTADLLRERGAIE